MSSLMCSNQPVIFDQLITLAIDCNGVDILPVNNFVHRVTLVKLVVISKSVLSSNNQNFELVSILNTRSIRNLLLVLVISLPTPVC